MNFCSRFGIAAGLVFALVGGISTGFPACAADPALIEAAKKEGQVIWYTTQIISQFGRPAVEAFQSKYGIRVNAVRGDSVELAARLLKEAQADRMQADVFDGTATGTALKKAGIVMKWLPDHAKQLPKEFWDPEEYWVATNIYVHTPAYNTNMVARGTEPHSLQDLLDPKWKGKMAWVTHATSSGGPGFVGMILAEMGEERGQAYLRQLAKQDIIEVGGSARALVDQAIAGEYPIVLQIFNHQPVISAGRGAPIEWIPMNPAMAILSVAGVTKAAPHPNAGKLLVDFFVSDEGQRIFREGDYVPVAPEIAPRVPALRPDGKTFRGNFFTPEQIDASMPHWGSVFKEIFH